MSAFETQTQAPPQSAPRDAITIGKTAMLSGDQRLVEVHDRLTLVAA